MNTIPQPSTKSLIWSFVTSIILASLIFFIAVLPAEFNTDPTGLGKLLGLTVLAKTAEETVNPGLVSCPQTVEIAVENTPQGTKLANEQEQEHDHENGHSHDHGHEHGLGQTGHHSHLPAWKDTVVITIPPKKGLEYKFYILKGEKFEFIWKTEGAELYFDFHGEPEGDKTGYFKSFKVSTQNKSSGTLLVPFTGSHGWYWQNKTSQSINITLKTRGSYKTLGLM
jgi:hypothetical protein